MPYRMPDDPLISHSVDQVNQRMAAQKTAAQRLGQYMIAQESAKVGFEESTDLNAWNPFAIARNFQSLERRAREKGRQEEPQKQEKAEEGISIVEKLQETSEFYQRKNPELQARTLLALRARITPGDSVDDILRKLLEVYSDLSLADEALDFLIESADANMQEVLKKSKEELNRRYEREIRAGRNMAIQARNFSSQGLGSPTALRDLYRGVTANPRDAYTLFQELSSKYPFEKMKAIIEFMLHSLGADVKAKGPSIAKGELHRLMTETKNMQAILGVFRYFQSRMRLIDGSFAREGLTLSVKLGFEALSKAFMNFIQDKYPSAQKALALAQQLGIGNEDLAKLIIYLQFRDAMRGVSPRLFRDDRHRQELLNSFMEALEDLEEEQEKKEGKKKKKRQRG